MRQPGTVRRGGARWARQLASALLLALTALPVRAQQQADTVRIRVDTRADRGAMTPTWAWFGYDEPNYTYMKDGSRLLTQLQALSPVPVHVRTHNLLTTGDGRAALKWGSTNAYTEDASGKPVYDWTIVDRILDAYVHRGMKPFVEIGFMPEALSTHPEPYRHHWNPADAYSQIFTGWAYPPRDYDRWRELVYQWVKHSVEKYGRKEVESWYWELWNEPDIGYWQGTPEEYARLYDYTVDGVKRALPTARIGGPEVTGPLGQRTQGMLRDFLEHTLRGTNAATGGKGAPLDLITFHAKGAPRVMPDGHVRMSVATQLRAIDNGFSIIAAFPELKQLPVVIGESDPEGCAACPARTNPANAYRNGTMYSSYTAEQLTRTYELMDRHGANLVGSVTWAFEFENQPYFDGFRDLSTNGIPKPVLNVFRMLGQMGGRRVAVQSSGALPLDSVVKASVQGRPDIDALASRDHHSTAVLVYNYHDDDVPAPAAPVELLIEGVPATRATLTHYRVDRDHSNAYEAWKRMGSPQQPTAERLAELQKASELQTLGAPAAVKVVGGSARVRFELPRQGVSLVTLRW
jgi:xylan 1,4-beta-xylosidase